MLKAGEDIIEQREPVYTLGMGDRSKQKFTNYPGSGKYELKTSVSLSHISKLSNRSELVQNTKLVNQDRRR